ncbi:MAG TPA: hypothetical protein VIK69_10300 [Methylophilaceae bacterium]
MITAIGIFKLVIGKAIGVVKFAIEHWRIVLPAIVIIVAAWHYMGLRAERDNAIKDLNEYVHQAELEKAAREAENAEKARIHQNILESSQKLHAEQIAKLEAQYHALKSTSSRTIADLRSELRDAIKAAHDSRLSGISETIGTSPESGRNGDTAVTGQEEYLEALEIGCAITTADYNALWNDWNDACQVYGCR